MGKGKAQQADIEARFVLGKELGEGGNAKVFLSQKKDSGETVALKRLGQFDAEKEVRFLNEIHIMSGDAAIKGVLPVLESSEEHFWYTMPVAEPVMKPLANTEEWTAERIVEVFVPLAETLCQLQVKGLSHRDIKPDNIYFLDGRLCFGDFRLVDFPDAETLTHSDRALGSTFTIAPEMKRNPKGADGKPADVYSMAKTLWMLLTRDDKGFDGQYNEDDLQHSLNAYSHLKEEHLLEIEELMAASTQTEPAARPTMQLFTEGLREWQQLIAAPDLCQERDWQHLGMKLFNGIIPESVTYRKPSDITSVLNAIAMSPAYNHMFTPPRGGLDLYGAELAAEDGCICVHATGCWIIMKPKALYFESFEDVRWNYFLLEADPQEPVVGKEVDEWDEFVVEDTPGHYVSGIDSCYGVYDYDSGIPFPKGWRGVCRVLKGKYLFVMKRGNYNKISATYDGRHLQCSAEDFRSLIVTYQLALNVGKEQGRSEDDILDSDFFRFNPYGQLEWPQLAHSLPSPKTFIDENYKQWQFTLPDTTCDESALVYYFKFDT